MGGSSSTISNLAPMAGNLRVQTAVYGAVIPLVYGRTRISGNLIWYGGFKAIPHTTSTTSGGKGGGGVTQTDTTYTYTAALMMALGEGVMNGIVSAWSGKTRFTAQAAGASLQQRSITAVVPAGGVINAPGWSANVQVTDTRVEDFDTYIMVG